jgi:hypothetical protein
VCMPDVYTKWACHSAHSRPCVIIFLFMPWMGLVRTAGACQHAHLACGSPEALLPRHLIMKLYACQRSDLSSRQLGGRVRYVQVTWRLSRGDLVTIQMVMHPDGRPALHCAQRRHTHQLSTDCLARHDQHRHLKHASRCCATVCRRQAGRQNLSHEPAGRDVPALECLRLLLVREQVLAGCFAHLERHDRGVKLREAGQPERWQEIHRQNLAPRPHSTCVSGLASNGTLGAIPGVPVVWALSRTVPASTSGDIWPMPWYTSAQNCEQKSDSEPLQPRQHRISQQRDHFLAHGYSADSWWKMLTSYLRR